MTTKETQDALLRDSVDRLWKFCDDMSKRLDGALFKKDVEPYTKLIMAMVTVVLSAIIVALLKLIIK